MSTHPLLATWCLWSLKLLARWLAVLATYCIGMLPSLQTSPHYYKSSPPFPVNDVVMVPGLLSIFLHSCKIKSGRNEANLLYFKCLFMHLLINTWPYQSIIATSESNKNMDKLSTSTLPSSDAVRLIHSKTNHALLAYISVKRFSTVNIASGCIKAKLYSPCSTHVSVPFPQRYYQTMLAELLSSILHDRARKAENDSNAMVSISLSSRLLEAIKNVGKRSITEWLAAPSW